MRPQELPAVVAMLAERMPDLARDLAGEPTARSGGTWRWRCKGSLAVVVAGAKRGAWCDHEAGAGGDALGLVAHLRGTPMRDARAWALAWLGEPDGRNRPAPPRPVAPPEARREASPSATLDLARRLWREALPGDDPRSLVPAYLAARGAAWWPELGGVLRFHHCAWRNGANGPRGPAMLGLMRRPDGLDPCGVHVTYLRPDGSGKADGPSPKVMLGAVGTIALAPLDELGCGLALAEGIETACRIMHATGARWVWAATSAGAIARFPVLPGFASLTVFADADHAGMEAARTCCRRWAAAGRETWLRAPAAGDWDDALPRAGRAA